MAYEYSIVGSQRFTQQGYVGSTRSDYATRVFGLVVAGSSTSATAYLATATGTGSQLTTATALGTTTFVVASPVNSSTTYCWGDWDSSYGIVMDGPVLLLTKTGFSFAVVSYMQVLK